MIGICILIFFLGATVGMVLTVLAMASSCDESYEIGYEKGKEEEKQRIVRKLDEYKNGGTAK